MPLPPRRKKKAWAIRISNFAVLFDACVLYPAPLRDFLMELAMAGLFRAKWTDAIHEEWIRNLLTNRPDLTEAKLARTRSLMDAAVPDCLVFDYQALIPSLTLPDPDDRHVLAAAIKSRADLILTFNLKDYPREVLETYNIEAQHPDEFIQHQIGLDHAKVIIAAQNCRKRLINPACTADQYLDTLEAQSLPLSVAELRPYAQVL